MIFMDLNNKWHHRGHHWLGPLHSSTSVPEPAPPPPLFYQVGVIDNTNGKLFIMCSDMFFPMDADKLISMDSDMRFPLHGLYIKSMFYTGEEVCTKQTSTLHK